MSSVLEDLYTNIGKDYDFARVSDPQDEEYKGKFKITDQGGAIWALRKLKLINNRLAERKQTAAAEIERIQAWLKVEEEKAERERGFFESLLRQYMYELRQQDPKLKSVTLPGGKLAVRKQQPEYTYDEALILPWAKDNLPDAVVVKETINKNAVKTYVKETGEVIPGLTIEDRADKFIVEVHD